MFSRRIATTAVSLHRNYLAVKSSAAAAPFAAAAVCHPNIISQFSQRQPHKYLSDKAASSSNDNKAT